MPIIFRLAARNVLKNWRHSLAAMLSIAAGFVALVLFEGYMFDLQERYRDMVSGRQMLGDILIEKKGAQENGHRDDWDYQLGPKDQEIIDQFLLNEGSSV